MSNKRLLVIFLTIAVILFIPFVAMQFTQQVVWTGRDFLAMGLLLSSTGLLCEFILRNAKTLRQQLLFCGVVLLGFALVWAEMAVGIFGSPLAGS